MGDADRRWDADDLRRVEPDSTAYDVTPDGAMPPQVIRSDSGPYSQYSPLGEANQIVSFSRAAGRSGVLGRIFVWALVVFLLGGVVLGVVNWFSQPDDPGSQTSDSP
jgi:preprotein translocase subunit SecG